MKMLFPLSLSVLLLAGCAQVETGSIPVEDLASSNPYGVIDIQERPEAPEGVDQGMGEMGDESTGTTVYVAPQGGEAISTEAPAPVDPSNLDADGLYALGRQYIEGDGVEVNQAIGEHYLSLSAELGKDEAKRVLGLLGLKKNPADREALAMLEDAAQTSVKAQMQLGFLYANQAQPYLNDRPKGLGLIEQAYKSGSAEAAFYYSRLIASSDPAGADVALAFSAQHDYPKALVAYAKTQGKGKASADVYLRAARAGDVASMYDYANGLLIQKYKPTLRGFAHPAEAEALAWFSVASDLGNAQAAVEVANLKGVAVELKNAGVSLDELKARVKVAEPESVPGGLSAPSAANIGAEKGSVVAY